MLFVLVRFTYSFSEISDLCNINVVKVTKNSNYLYITKKACRITPTGFN